MLNKTLIILTLTSLAIATTTQAIAYPRPSQQSEVKSPGHLYPENTVQSDLASIISPHAREGNKEKIVDSGRPPRE